MLEKRQEMALELGAARDHLLGYPNCMVDIDSPFGKRLLKILAIARIVDGCIRHNNLIGMVLED